MQTESDREQMLVWKKLEKNILVSQFASSNADRSRIYVKKFEALKKDPKRNITIFLLHDIGQYHGRYLSFITWVQNHVPGISFIAMDFVGHGLSSGTRGNIEKFENLVVDILFLLNHTAKLDQEKWLLLGHGLGGLVTLDLMSTYPDLIESHIDGMIISNFILTFNSALLQFENRLSDAISGFNRYAAHLRPLRVLKGEVMLSDPEYTLIYEQDPLVVHRPTLITIKEIQKKVSNIYQDSYFIGKPMMLLKSGKDEVVNLNGMDYFAKGIKKELLTEKKYSLMKHDLYNEVDKESVFKDITDWMKKNEN